MGDGGDESAPGAAGEVLDVADQFAVARRAGAEDADGGGQRRRQAGARAVRVATTQSALVLHPLRLSPFRLRELRRDHHQAKVDHEERADLPPFHHNNVLLNRQSKWLHKSVQILNSILILVLLMLVVFILDIYMTCSSPSMRNCISYILTDWLCYCHFANDL